MCLAFAPSATAAAPLATRLAQALAVPGISTTQSSADRDRPRNRPDPLHAQRRPLARTSLEREAHRHLRGARRARARRIGSAPRCSGVGSQEENVWHGDVFLKGYGDPTLTSPELEGLAEQLTRARHHAHRRAGARRRVVVRRAANGAGLEGGVLHQRVAAALGARRRPRPLRRPHGTTACRSRRRACCAGCCCGTGSPRAPSQSAARLRGAYGLAQVESEPLPDVLKEMDRDSDNFMAELILKEIGAEAGEAAARRPRASASCCAISRTRACRSQACACSTARACRSTTG